MWALEPTCGTSKTGTPASERCSKMTRDRQQDVAGAWPFREELLARPRLQREKRWRRNPRHGRPKPPDQPWTGERGQREQRSDAEEEEPKTTTRRAAPAPVRARGGGYHGRTRHGRWEPNRASVRMRTKHVSDQEARGSEGGNTRRYVERPETTAQLRRPRTRRGSVRDTRSPLSWTHGGDRLGRRNRCRGACE
jgi:hypothetical protein